CPHPAHDCSARHLNRHPENALVWRLSRGLPGHFLALRARRVPPRALSGHLFAHPPGPLHHGRPHADEPALAFPKRGGQPASRRRAFPLRNAFLRPELAIRFSSPKRKSPGVCHPAFDLPDMGGVPVLLWSAGVSFPPVSAFFSASRRSPPRISD